MSLRLFVAIYPPVQQRAEIAARRARLALPGARWVRESQLHLTVLFLGECPESELPAIEAGLTRAAEDFARFALELRGVDYFPHGRRARVAFLRGAGGAEESAELARRVREQLGARAGENFVPHLTLARFRAAPDRESLLALQRHFEGERWEFQVEELCLVQSDLGADGATHRLRRRFALRPVESI